MTNILWYVFYIRIMKADSACKNVRNLIHDVVPWKRYVLQGTYLFEWFVIFKTVWPSSIFFGRSGRRPSSSGHVPRVTCSFICAYIVCTWNFTIVCAIVFSDRVHDRTNDLFSWSRVQTPGLARDLFCGSRVRFPGLAAWSFCGSRVQFSDLITCFRPVVSVAYVMV